MKKIKTLICWFGILLIAIGVVWSLFIQYQAGYFNIHKEFSQYDRFMTCLPSSLVILLGALCTFTCKKY